MKVVLAATVALLFSIRAVAGDWILDNESNCKIWNPAPVTGESIRWSGKCTNGFADGKGEVIWYVNGVESEKTTATFRSGKITGQAQWEFYCGGPGKNKIKRYQGEFDNNIRNGFAETEYCDGTKTTGWWEGNGFKFSCVSRSNCLKVAEQRAREEQKRYERACENYYPGRVGRIEANGWLATKDGFIVRYVNKAQRTVTIEGTSGGNTLKYGEMKELSCSTLLDYER